MATNSIGITLKMEILSRNSKIFYPDRDCTYNDEVKYKGYTITTTSSTANLVYGIQDFKEIRCTLTCPINGNPYESLDGR